METLREIYWEALRAPTDRVDLRRDPYLRQRLKKKVLGRTKAERDKKKRELKKFHEDHKAAVDAKIAEDEEAGVGTPREHKEKRV